MHKSAGATFGHIFQYAHILDEIHPCISPRWGYYVSQICSRKICRAKMPCSEAKYKHAEYHVCFRIDKINDNT